MPGNSKDGNGFEINNPYGNQGKSAAVTKSTNFKSGSQLQETGLAQVQSASTAQKLDKFIS